MQRRLAHCITNEPSVTRRVTRYLYVGIVSLSRRASFVKVIDFLHVNNPLPLRTGRRPVRLAMNIPLGFKLACIDGDMAAVQALAPEEWIYGFTRISDFVRMGQLDVLKYLVERYPECRTNTVLSLCFTFSTITNGVDMLEWLYGFVENKLIFDVIGLYISATALDRHDIRDWLREKYDGIYDFDIACEGMAEPFNAMLNKLNAPEHGEDVNDGMEQ